MRPLLQRLADGDVLVADGAMGTQLFARGVEAGQCPERINLDRPEVLEEIAASYVEAGADLVQTNTFGASPLKLGMYGLADKTAEINRIAVEAARRAAGKRAFVSGSCGPDRQDAQALWRQPSRRRWLRRFAAQIAAMAEAGVDCVCVETMTDLGEACLAIRAARDVAPGLPVMATMTFDPTPRGFFTIMGVAVAQAVAGLADAGADVVGSNCGNGSENMVAIARVFREHTDLPVLIQANAGLPRASHGELVYPESPDFMARRASELVLLGTAIVGGCCGTTPDHIRAIRRVVDSPGG